MNPINKSSLVQALGLGLASAAAASLTRGSAKRGRFGNSPLGFLGGMGRSRNPFIRGLAGGLFSAPLLGNFIGGRNVKDKLLRSALLGLGAGLGSLANQQQRGAMGRGGILGAFGGSRMGGAFGKSGLGTLGRLVAGGLVAAAASKLINNALRERREHEPHAHERNSRGRNTEPQTQETRGQGGQAQEQRGF